MKRSSVAIVLLLALVLVTFSACGPQSQLQKYSVSSFEYFDTFTAIEGYAASQEEFDAIAGKVLEELALCDRLFSIYDLYEDFENLYTINRVIDGAHRVVKVDRRIIDMLTYAKEAYELTNGRVNVAMGSVLSIWHDYREAGTDEPWNAQLPPMEKLLAAAEHTNIHDVVIDEEACTVFLADPKMRLDVGAIAKGYAVELAAQILKDLGVENYSLNVGGNVRTVGAKATGDPWKVGIENPNDDGSDYLAILGIVDKSVVTSGSYQRYYWVGNERYHHVIDPDTLMPSDYFTSVSVVTESSALGDALSTALFCMSLEAGLTLIESLPDAEAIWLLLDGTRVTSSGFAGYTA